MPATRNTKSSFSTAPYLAARTTSLRTQAPPERFTLLYQGDPFIFTAAEMTQWRPQAPPKPFTSQYSPESFKFTTAEMKQWVEEELPKRWNRPKTLILWGPSRTGKTEWARSLGKQEHSNFIRGQGLRWCRESFVHGVDVQC